MRSKRLAKDYLSMLDLHNKSKLISIDCFGEPPVRYNVIYYCRSLVWLDGNQSPSYSSRHQLEIYLHKDYPRLPKLLKSDRYMSSEYIATSKEWRGLYRGVDSC